MSIRGKRAFLLAAGALLVLIAGGIYWMQQQGDEEKTLSYNGHGGMFKNTLAEIDTPDPSVVYRDGFYYMTFTHNGADIMVMKSRTLDFRAAERKVVWYPPAETAYSANLWAPEIQYLQGKWYIYFAADDGDNANHRMYVLEGESGDPMGSYAFKGQIKDDSDKWAIDGLAMEHEGKLYFVWSGWEGDVNEAQNTYIAPMSDPWTISGPRVLLSRPELDWEKAGGPPYINEGQSLLYKDGRAFIVYSGAGSWTPLYSLGLLALKPGGNPLEPSDWTKAQEPLLAMDEEAGVYGPGHNSFVPSPDGSEAWLVYHATSGAADGWNNRKARAARVEWDENGLPVFGKPQSLATPLRMPSGTGVFQAKDAVRDGDRLLFGAIPSTVEAGAPVRVHYRNAGGSEAAASIGSEAGGAAELKLAPTDADSIGYAYAQVGLREGMNELAVEAAGSGVEVLAVEIPRYEAEWAAFGGDAAEEENPYASRGAAAGLYGEGDTLRFANVSVPRGGKYTVSVAVLNPSEGAELSLAANGGRKKAVKLKAQERNARGVYEAELELAAGENELVLFDSRGSFIIDYVDIWRRPG
ncbi:family 43 glycosylhydrolase [Paenibacillus humicus]|uniref:family 43 glycosylhydrolase n=1 Tax=Paenibacillus humicus TaxID=412861 RepID=UPI001FEBC84D|nr:family 43 glycosylhydrolase [Paenibacillus humicus]